MEKYSKVIMSNMCMVYKNDEILVIDRNKKDWPGINFPGGHINDDETIIESTIREVKEETNLTISDLIPCGVMEWDWGNNIRYLAFLYKTDKFEGELKSGVEGEVFWIKLDDLNKYKLSIDFDKIVEMMIKK